MAENRLPVPCDPSAAFHDAAALNEQALSLHERAQLEQAVRLYTFALQRNPDFLPAYCNRAQAFVLLGRWAEAESDLREALRRSPDSAHTRLRLAELLFERGDFGGACRQAEAVLAAPGVTAPFRGEALYLRAMVRLVTGDGAAAYRDIVESAKAGHPPALELIGQMREDFGGQTQQTK